MPCHSGGIFLPDVRRDCGHRAGNGSAGFWERAFDRNVREVDGQASGDVYKVERAGGEVQAELGGQESKKYANKVDKTYN